MVIKVTTFFANYGFYLYTSIELLRIYDDKQKSKFLTINQIVKKQDKIIKFLQD